MLGAWLARVLVGAVCEAHDPIFSAGLWVFLDRLEFRLQKGTPEAAHVLNAPVPGWFFPYLPARSCVSAYVF
jgi:hypothetical protein